MNIWFTRRTQPYAVLALASGIIAAFAAIIDNYVLHSLIVSPDPLISSLTYTVAGYWSAIPITLLCNRFVGHSVNMRITALTFNKQTQKWAAIAGGVTGIATLFGFIGSKLVDPSIALPLASIYIAYLAIYDVWKLKDWKSRKQGLREIAAPVALVMLGIASASAEPMSAGGISMAAILFIVILSQGSTTVAQTAYKRGVDSTDVGTFFFWRLIWSTVIATISVIVITALTGHSRMLIAALASSFLSLFVWLPLRMVLLYLSEVSRGRAYQAGGPTSEVAILRASQVMLAVPITLLVSNIAPQAFGYVTSDLLIWGTRFLGAALILVGIILLYHRRVKCTPQRFSSARQTRNLK
ncbi:MAG TPA: hypothetical protein VKR06_17815 [Ktedonosporobacter sp.]|nr:hypothetical protein [Ktedonosporobacter sp.]